MYLLHGAFQGSCPPVFSSIEPPTKEVARALVADMPSLAGRPLQPPAFHKTQWKIGATFLEADDPDRTSEAWEPPAFAAMADPLEQRSRTALEELDVPRASFPRRFARVVRGVLSPDRCAELIESVNRKGFTPALLNVGMGRQKLIPEVRDGHRVIVDSPALASWLFEVLRPYLPEELEDGSRLVELNERLRFLCYTPGQAFEEHCDGRYVRPRGHPRAGDWSVITVQLYLHDVPQECGGATAFHPGTASSVAHQPEAGSVLLFTQDLPHEGSVVKSGVKYTLRTEAMYTRRSKTQMNDAVAH